MSKYRMYVDEVGNPDLKSSEHPNHRFLSLTGVIIDLDYVRTVIHPEMEALKQRFFISHPDEPVIFHRKELVNKHHPFEVLANPRICQEFDETLLDMLQKWDYRVITVCIDKLRHCKLYTTWRYDPYHYCLAVLLERFNYWLNRHQSRGDVMAESRGGKEDMRLKRSFRRLWESGTEYVEAEQFQNSLTSRELKVKPKSANISGLQIADLVAHPSRAEILYERQLSDKPPAPFAGKIISILQTKYDQDNDRIFGKKLL